MKIHTFVVILILIKTCCGEIPMNSCSNLLPFKTKENNCANFTSICVKTDDAECKSFLDICSQCPATNYSVLMFHDIAQVKAEKKDTDKKLSEITNELYNLKTNINHTTDKIYNLLYVCVAIILLLLLVLILEIRFKLITKILIKWRRRGNYVLLDSRKSDNRKDLNEKITMMTESIKIVPEIHQKVTQILQNFKNLSNPNRKKTKVYVKGYQDPIEIEIDKKNTIVQVKKLICSELQNCGPNSYKIMKLSVHGNLIDDNRYFSSLDLSEEDKIICEFDNNADPNDNVVIQLKGNVKLPKLIHIEKYRTISYLRNVISRIENINENHKIFILDKISKSQLKEINTSTTIEECQLEDDDVMQIILQKNEDLEIRSIFNDDTLIRIEYSNVDLVGNLRKSIADKLQCDQNEFFLLLNDLILSNDKFAFEYLRENHPSVKYCKFMELNDIEINDKILVKGTFDELFSANIKQNNEEILIKRYNIMITAEIEDNYHIIWELKKYNLTISHPRFIQVLDLYKDACYVFVAMENMPNGTLSLYLKSNPTIPENYIVMWPLQILQGLKFLHQNDIIHRDLNPKSIFLDGSLQIKLSNFNLSKYSDFHNQQTVHNKFTYKSKLPLRYVAPETITNQVCNPQSDVWSFGAIFLRIVTNKKPYWWTKKCKIINDIFANGCIDYKCPNEVPADKKKIIEMCMKQNSNDRPTVRELLEMPFFLPAETNVK